MMVNKKKIKHKTCVSIATNSPKKVLYMLKQALKRSDYAEIRFDFLEPSKIPCTLELCKKYMNRLVCTLRPKTEGGAFSGSKKERISIIKLIATYSPYLLDVEYNTIKKDRELATYLKKNKNNVLVSWHDFKKTPNVDVLVNKYRKMSKHSNYVKIVTMSKTVYDVTKVLSLYAVKSLSDIQLIAFCMGDTGKMSRIICLYFGSPYTYVSLGKPTAPGQYSLSYIKGLED